MLFPAVVAEGISWHWPLSIRPPPNTSENQRFGDVFKGCRKRSVAWNGLIENNRCNWTMVWLVEWPG